MTPYDQAARYLIRRAPLAFFLWVVSRLLTNWRFLRFIEPNTIAFPGEPERVCDTVAEFARKGRSRERLLADVEAQAQPHPDMLERLGEYAYRLRRELRHGRNGKGKYRVLSVLLNLTGKRQAAELDMTVAQLDSAGAQLKVVCWTLSEESATATLDRIERRELGTPILPWVVMMHGGDSATIRRWKDLASQEPDSRWRSDLGSLALLFSDLVGRRRIWERELKGWNMKESTVVRNWINEGRQEGRIETKRADLRKTLVARFPGVTDAAIEKLIDEVDDYDTLDRWFDAALQASTFDAFRAEVTR